MDLKPTKPLSGFIELLPEQQRCFDFCIEKMQSVLQLFGYNRLNLPSIERAEVLTDKENWDEIETQMFLFQKNDTKMGLRYDGTVGLSRYIAGHLNDLVFPFRAYQFARNYRGERPQKGRYREFYQMDVDILGIDTLSENYDVEIVTTLLSMYKSIEDLVGGVKVKIGNRKFWNAFFEYLQLDEKQCREAFVLIDKKDKIADFIDVLSEEIGQDKAIEINNVFIKGYGSFVGKTNALDIAIKELDDFLVLLNNMGVTNAEIDVSIMRGHAYYTGIVFEFFSTKFPEMSAIGGGGRYENLASKFSKTKIVGVGASIGVSRLLVSLMEENKIDITKFQNIVDVVVLTMGKQNLTCSMNVIKELRNNNIVAIPYLDIEKKFKNQMEYADKVNSKFSIIIGDDEVKNSEVTLKNMKTGEQVKTSIKKAIDLIKVA